MKEKRKRQAALLCIGAAVWFALGTLGLFLLGGLLQTSWWLRFLYNCLYMTGTCVLLTTGIALALRPGKK